MIPYAESQLLHLSMLPSDEKEGEKLFHLVALINTYLTCMAKNGRGNPAVSHVSMLQAKQCGVGFREGIGASMSMLDGLHAPISRTLHFYRSGQIARVPDILENGKGVIPGFGNSFIKESDPHLQPFFDVCKQYYDPVYSVFKKAESDLHDAGKMVYMNGASATALLCIILEIPDQIAFLPFLLARLPYWAYIYATGSLGPTN